MPLTLDVPENEPALASVPPLLVIVLANVRLLRSRVAPAESVTEPLPNEFELPALSVPAVMDVPAA